MPPPGKHSDSASEVHASFESVEALLLDEIETELPEVQTRSGVAKACPHDRVHEAIGVARSVAVAMLGTQVRHSQQGKALQIRVNKESRRREFREDLHRGSPVWIAHERQVEKRLGRSTVELRAQVRILSRDPFGFGMQRPG